MTETKPTLKADEYGVCLYQSMPVFLVEVVASKSEEEQALFLELVYKNNPTSIAPLEIDGRKQLCFLPPNWKLQAAR